MAAKEVLGDTRIERVGMQRILALQQAKGPLRYEKMQKSGLATNAAIALSSSDLPRRINLKPDAAAVATTRMRRH